jgi:hypothetical protein
MTKDARYDLIAPMISAGRIKHFRDIFMYIPKTIIASDLGINNVRFTRLIESVEDFLLRDLIRLAILMEIEPSLMLRLVLEQYSADRKGKSKSQGHQGRKPK